ncbi:MAG TPA: GAF domain-containing protein [Dissulfurispiraceae bacterium]|nr:GAF domain-containing protein [Dissulfurispiraceae bacterium]
MAKYTSRSETASAPDHRLAALQELSAAMLCTDDISTLGNLMLDCATSLTHAERASIMIPHPENKLYIVAARGLDRRFSHDRKVKNDKGIIGQVVRTKTPCWIQDIDKDDTLRPLKKVQYRTNSFISCPIISNTAPVGVLNVADKKDRSAFSSTDFAVIQMLANQAAAAFDRAFLIGQLKARIAELEDANARIVHAKKMEAEFALRCSHELRTPLNAIRGAALFLQKSRNISQTDQYEFYQIISHDTDRMLQTVQALLTRLQPQDDSRPGNQTPISFRELIGHITGSKALRNLFSRASVKLTSSLKENPADVVVDKNRYSELFMNVMELTVPYLQKEDVIALHTSDNSHAQLRILFPRRLPEPIISLLNDCSRDSSLEKLDLRLLISSIRKLIDANRWELRAENNTSGLELIVSVPKNTRSNREKVARKVLNRFADFICELLALNTCSIMVIDPLTNQLTIHGAHGISPEIIRSTRLEMGEHIAGQVAVEGKPRLIENVETDPVTMKLNRPRYNTQSLLSVPLIKNGRVFGVLNLNNKRSGETFTEADLALSTAIGARIAHIIEEIISSSLTESDCKMHLDSLDKLIDAVQSSSPGRSAVFGLMRDLSLALRLSREEQQQALYVSLLFDLGLSALNKRITAKTSLDPADLSVIRAHPRSTVNLINQFEISDEVCRIILHHHERYNGTGYPDGLRGEEIPLISRMLAVVDTYTAMTSERVYRKPFSAEKALGEIIAGAGELYDPAVVAAFQIAIRENSPAQYPQGPSGNA